VCRAWHTAAVAASTDVSLTHFSDNHDMQENFGKVEGLGEWLQKYGSAVQHLTICGKEFLDLYLMYDNLQVELPYAQLRQLQSLSCEACALEELGVIPASSGNSSSSALSLLTSLTALDLDNVYLGLDGGIQGISALTGLRELTLLQFGSNDSSDSSLLLHLPQLTALTIDKGGYCDSAHTVAAVVQLTQLRSLCLGIYSVEASDAAVLAALTNLTELHCSYWTKAPAPASSARRCLSERRTSDDHKSVCLISTVSAAELVHEVLRVLFCSHAVAAAACVMPALLALCCSCPSRDIVVDVALKLTVHNIAYMRRM
jgi:hypothetical protein